MLCCFSYFFCFYFYYYYMYIFFATACLRDTYIVLLFFPVNYCPKWEKKYPAVVKINFPGGKIQFPRC